MGVSHFCKGLRHSHGGGNPFESKLAAVDSRLHGNDRPTSRYDTEFTSGCTHLGSLAQHHREYLHDQKL